MEQVGSAPVRVTITALQTGHWPAVEQIYAQGIATGQATFETEPPTWDHFDHGKLPGHRWVAVGRREVLGWVAVSAVSDRRVYAGVVEVSVYVASSAQGQGVGGQLLDALVASTETAGIWTIQAGIFPENAASLALHHRAGFRTVGARERIALMAHGPMAGQWRDVELLERRSASTGH